ncbi:MAG: response regulator transcription factor [Deltaproteobacteria bacterium]|nr:response regulator transcription factor [Deltaproteobacteria bacterium]
MITSEFLTVAESLIHIDPVRSYPDRASKVVAGLVHAVAYRLEFNNGETITKFDSTPPPPANGTILSLPLRHGRRLFGTIDLYLRDSDGKLDSADLRLARWGARMLARGLSYANRLSHSTQNAKSRPPELLGRINREPLTRREKQVVTLLISGCSTRAIAEQTGLTVATVHTYLKRIYAKLGVHSRVELIARMAGTDSNIPPPPRLPRDLQAQAEALGDLESN